MTINVAFKIPDAAVFVTDGLATICEVDEHTGRESIVSSVDEVEKLVTLSDGRLIVMFNGIGSLGNGSVASEIRRHDTRAPRGPTETVAEYASRLKTNLEDVARKQLGILPRPFHVAIAGFDGDSTPPVLYEFKWPRDREPAEAPKPVLHKEPASELGNHYYGPFFAGATEAVSRFVDGFDPAMPEEAVAILAGLGLDGSPPGILEELIYEARRQEPPAPKRYPVIDAERLALRYAGRIVKAIFNPDAASLSEHFSLKEAINYAVFNAWCAYARENFSPARRGPPRVGSTLQVAFIQQGRSAEHARKIRFDVDLERGVFGCGGK